MENTNSPDTAEGKADAVYRKQPQHDVDRLQACQDVICSCTGHAHMSSTEVFPLCFTDQASSFQILIDS